MGRDYWADRNLIRNELSGNFVSADYGWNLRHRLHEIAALTYVPKRSAEQYIKWMNLNHPRFERVHGQDENHPNYLCLFTVVSQHVYGDCVEECLDVAMDMDADWVPGGKQ